MATVKDLLREKVPGVWVIERTDTIQKALELMAQKQIGALPVMDGETLVGIFSERDFARNTVAHPGWTLEAAVSMLMSHPVLYVTPGQSVEECMTVMTVKHLRHLPVLERGKVIAMISIGDVVKYLLEEKQSTIQGLEHFIWAHTLP